MPHFFVRLKPQTNGFHAVHSEVCPFLERNGSIDLGICGSGLEALQAAKVHFPDSELCIYCAEALPQPARHPNKNPHEEALGLTFIPEVFYFLRLKSAQLNSSHISLHQCLTFMED